MIGILASGAEEVAKAKGPRTILTPLWERAKEHHFGQWMGFADPERGQFWFDAIGFSLLAAIVLMLSSFVATRSYARVPRGLQNLLEWVVGLLRDFVRGMIGEKEGDKYLPYLGTTFLFIFLMNLLGILPAFRSPTMTLATTAALGITTFIVVQLYAIRATGIVQYVKHFMGPVAWLAPLMLALEVVSELARPVSLSLRLYGNIFGEDNVIETLMHMGHGIPVQLPIVFLAVLTSFIQAFVFTCLASIYIGTKVVHDEPASHGHH